METTRKFKGHNGSRWVYGFYVQIEDNHFIYENGTPVLCDPDSIGQHTGFNDTNGTEIYEGDYVIVKRHSRHPWLHVARVYYDKEKNRYTADNLINISPKKLPITAETYYEPGQGGIDGITYEYTVVGNNYLHSGIYEDTYKIYKEYLENISIPYSERRDKLINEFVALCKYNL